MSTKPPLINPLSNPFLGIGAELLSDPSFTSGIAGWSEARASSTLSNPSGRLRCTSDSTSICGASLQVTGLVTGLLYRIVGTVIRGDSTGLIVPRFQSSSGLTTDSNIAEFANPTQGFFYGDVTAKATTMYFGFIMSGHGAGEYFEADNVSIRLHST